MAVLEIYAIRSRMDDRIKYALNPEKTSCMGFPNLNGLPDTLTDAVNCFCDNAYEQMLRTKSYFGKEDQVLGYHFIQSFKPGETTPQQAHEIGLQFAERCFGERFEAVIGTHTDKSHLHNHIVINSVSFEDGRKYRSTPKTFYELRSISDEICKEYGLSVIKKPSVKAGKHYAEWKAEKEGRPTMRGMIREDIDVILAQARTIDEFWDMLRGRGYEIRINERRKYVTVRHPNGERFIRLKSLGDEYTPRQLAARIAAQRGNVVQNIRQIQMQQQNRGKRKKYYPMPHTAAPQKHKKLHGFRALYWRYLYKIWNVTAKNRGTAEVVAKLNTGETTSFTVNVYELNTGGDTGDGVITVPGTGDKKPGDDINTGDITIDIPITKPDGSDDTITVTPEIPDDTTLEEGENQIDVTVDVDGVTIHITMVSVCSTGTHGYGYGG